MDIHVFEKLFSRQLLQQEELDSIKAFKKKELLSVQWDLRIVLYAGILMLMSGLGIVVYENIDTIGHSVIIALIAIACLACFFYCFKKSTGYSNAQVASPDVWFDYVLLLGCLLMLLFTGYIQYQYKVFGQHFGMATFTPMVLLFFAAYYFDNRGVLSIAITNLAAWVGITVTPAEILSRNDFTDEGLIYSGVILGAGLVAFSIISFRKNIKAHFAFTYKNFGVHIFFIALLAGLFHFDDFYLLWFVVLAGCCWLMFRHALKEVSFYFLVITVLYFYIGLSFVILTLFFDISDGIAMFYLTLIYLIASGIGLIRLLIYYNKKIKSDDSIRKE